MDSQVTCDPLINLHPLGWHCILNQGINLSGYMNLRQLAVIPLRAHVPDVGIKLTDIDIYIYIFFLVECPNS